MSLLLVKLRTAFALGLPNVLRVVVYRLSLRIGLSRVRRIRAQLPPGPYFHDPKPGGECPPASTAWQDEAPYFGWYSLPLDGGIPDWLADPLGGRRFPESSRPWWQIPDFDAAGGDIKAIWEASRFDWILALAERARAGRPEEVGRINAWVADWCATNPAYAGPNWKCGQEASIRVLHMAVAALLLDQTVEAERPLCEVVHAHLIRIAPTISYAIAQDNNHGTSEAAALYVGGTWLAHAGNSTGRAQGEQWAESGRKLLEERVARLVAQDGSFSQHSIVYHRVLLDTLGIAEVWRRRLDLPQFSAQFHERARRAALFLRSFVQPRNGDAPNIGANDGARLLPLGDCDSRDFRPSAQLACALFGNVRAIAQRGPWDVPLRWLGVKMPEGELPELGDEIFDDGGYAILRNRQASAYLRFPRFRFRPSHADALHLDLWLEGRNVLRDAGTFGYNAEVMWAKYFPGTAAHNTVEFDSRDQMPRLGRFLFGDWLRTSQLSQIERQGDETRITAGYRDSRGASHVRRVHLSTGRMVVEDEVSGFHDRAVLRWRLEPGDWRLEGPAASNGSLRLQIASSVQCRRIELVEGWESRYYLKCDPLPVLEYEIGSAGIVRTEMEWAH